MSRERKAADNERMEVWSAAIFQEVLLRGPFEGWDIDGFEDAAIRSMDSLAARLKKLM